MLFHVRAFLALTTELTLTQDDTCSVLRRKHSVATQLTEQTHLQLLLLGLPVPPDLDAALAFAGASAGVSCIRLHLPAYQCLLHQQDTPLPSCNCGKSAHGAGSHSMIPSPRYTHVGECGLVIAKASRCNVASQSWVAAS